MLLSARHVGGMLAVVAVMIVPAALAESPDDQAGPRGPGTVDATTVPLSVRPDDLAEPRGPGALPSTSVRPDDRPAHGIGPTTVAPIAATETSDFDWTYVGVAAVLAVVAALVVGAVVVSRHHGGPGRLAPHT